MHPSDSVVVHVEGSRGKKGWGGDALQDSRACLLVSLVLETILPLLEPPVPCSAGLGCCSHSCKAGSLWVCEAAAFCASVVEPQGWGGAEASVLLWHYLFWSSQGGAVLQQLGLRGWGQTVRVPSLKKSYCVDPGNSLWWLWNSPAARLALDVHSSGAC